MNTLIFLMNPDGYPALTDDFVNGYRIYAIQDILFDKFLDRNNIVIVSTAINTDRYKEMKVLMESAGYNWLELDSIINISQLKHELQKQYNFKLDSEDTNIIYGGTNTSYEVMYSTDLSLGQFAKRNFNCQLYLPLCADITQPGICQIDKEMKAYSQVYDFINQNKLFDKVDILTRFADLKLPWKEKNNA
jgi:hypothetical protein